MEIMHVITINNELRPTNYYGWHYDIATILMFTNSIINPFIYAAKYREFQNGVRRFQAKMAQSQESVVTT